MAFEARLPPLQPKVSAKLTLLAAGNGSLFAGPSTGGGLLQWGRPEGNMRRPLQEGIAWGRGHAQCEGRGGTFWVVQSQIDASQDAAFYLMPLPMKWQRRRSLEGGRHCFKWAAPRFENRLATP